jgi:putative ABC transport system permease protein
MSCRRDLYRRNIVYFKRYYRLLLWSVVVAVAVIVGSLTVGDSVRGTLRALVEERLGRTETIIFAQESFLDERIMSDHLFAEAKGYLLVEGFVAHEGRLLPVMVWGTKDERLESGQMLINEPLEKEMGGVPEGEVVLRLPAEGLVPSGSMFVTDTYTTSLRLGVQGVMSAEEGGNVNLRTEQVQPFNVFVPHAALAEAMGVEGRINIVMSERAIATRCCSPPESAAAFFGISSPIPSSDASADSLRSTLSSMAAPSSLSGSSTLSRTVLPPSRLNCWNTTPT